MAGIVAYIPMYSKREMERIEKEALAAFKKDDHLSHAHKNSAGFRAANRAAYKKRGKRRMIYNRG